MIAANHVIGHQAAVEAMTCTGIHHSNSCRDGRDVHFDHGRRLEVTRQSIVNGRPGSAMPAQTVAAAGAAAR